MIRGKRTPLLEIDIDLIDSDEGIRKFCDENKIAELAESVRESGILEPLIVQKKKGGRYSLIIGSRRLRAANMINLKTVPAFSLEHLHDKDVIIMTLSENIQREDLTPFEEAWAILRLLNDYNMEANEVAMRLGISPDTVKRRIQLLSLPEEVQEMVSDGDLALSHVSTLAGISSVTQQIEFANTAKDNSLSQQELKVLIGEQKNHRSIRSPLRPKDRGRGRSATVQVAPPAAIKRKSINGSGKSVKGDLDITGTKAILKIKVFTHFIQALVKAVVKMPGTDIINVKVALRTLAKELRKVIDSIEEQCGNF